MEIAKVVVLGAGTMGAGIAQVCAQVGCEVVLFDVNSDATGRGMAGIGKFLGKGVERGKLTEQDKADTLARISTSTDLEAAVAGANLVVEAAPEDLALKRGIFEQVAAAAPADALLATNTSSLPISQVAEANPAAGRIVGMHFFNPVPLMKLLEIVVGRETTDDTTAAVKAFGERLGKEVITVQDAPGFATRWGPCGSRTWSAWMSAWPSPGTWPRRSRRPGSSRRRCSGTWSRPAGWARSPAGDSTSTNALRFGASGR